MPAASIAAASAAAGQRSANGSTDRLVRIASNHPQRVEAAVDILTWLIVGLIAGVLASFVMGGVGYGIVGDIVVGIVGAFVGGWLFARLGAGAPFGGLAGTIFVAFIGAVGLLFLIRLIRGGTRGVP